MAISDNELIRELITAGLDERAADALLSRLGSGTLGVVGHTSGVTGSAKLGAADGPINWLGNEPLGVQGVTFAGNRTTFAAGLYSLSLEVAGNLATKAKINTFGYSIAGPSKGIFDVGYDGWNIPLTADGGSISPVTYPLLSFADGDWMEWSGSADVADDVSVILHVMKLG